MYLGNNLLHQSAVSLKCHVGDGIPPTVPCNGSRTTQQWLVHCNIPPRSTNLFEQHKNIPRERHTKICGARENNKWGKCEEENRNRTEAWVKNKVIRKKQEIVTARETVLQEHLHVLFQLSPLNSCFHYEFLTRPSFSACVYYPMTAHRNRVTFL